MSAVVEDVGWAEQSEAHAVYGERRRRVGTALRAFAHLIARGKAHSAALVACARKLLIYANTVVQRGTPWVEKPATT